MPRVAFAGTVPLAHETIGSGFPWVFLHGFPLARRLWSPQRIAGHGQRVFVDLRGFGDSPTAPTATTDEMARDVLAAMSALGHETFGVVGHSLGGYVAFGLHRQAPGRVAALALVDTQARPDTPEAAAKRLDLAAKVERDGTLAAEEAFLGKMLAPANRGGPSLEQVRDVMRGNKPAGLAAALRGMAERPDARPQLAAVRCPTLVVVGEHDELTPLDLAEEMANGITGARLVVIPHAGHVPNLENAPAFEDAFRSLARRLAEG
ncbi:MAG TPA: alpha/beta fold hydrolase [Candidatus Thermoplasmatota archaeon]|nr:alpha/beta fold hydrolase [Candidatus Thermoplasmatota archaeon]